MIDSVSSAESRGLESGENYKVLGFNAYGNLIVALMFSPDDVLGHGASRFRLVRRS